MLNSKENDTSTKILIVDDQFIIRKHVISLLYKLSKEMKIPLEILEGVDGWDIIKWFQIEGNSIKLIITDEEMLQMNGSEAIKLVREYEKNCDLIRIPIISLTSSYDDKISYILNSGADEVLNKPLNKFQMKEIFEKIFT